MEAFRTFLHGLMSENARLWTERESWAAGQGNHGWGKPSLAFNHPPPWVYGMMSEGQQREKNMMDSLLEALRSSWVSSGHGACWDRCRLAFMVFQAIKEVFMGTLGDHVQVSWKCSIVSRRLQEMSRRAWWKLRRRSGGGQRRRSGGESSLDHWLAGARKMAQPGAVGAWVLEEVIE